MFKKLLIAALLFATTACSTQHSFMDKAVVGNVDGSSRTTVMFPVGVRNGVMLYKPQFSSDCPSVYNPLYQTDNNGTGCLVREERIVNLRAYRDHTNVVVKENSISRGTNQHMEDIPAIIKGNTY